MRRPYSKTIRYTLDCPRPGCDGQVEVMLRGEPGTPDVWNLPNGDPGYPGDPPDIWVEDILSIDCDHDLTPEEVNDVSLEEAWDDVVHKFDELWDEPDDYI